MAMCALFPDHPLLIQKDGDCSIYKRKHVSNYLSASIIRRIMIRSHDDPDRVEFNEEDSWHISAEPFHCFHIHIWIRWSATSLSLDHDEHKVKLCKEFRLNRQISRKAYVPYINLTTSREQESRLGNTSSGILTYSINFLWSLLFNRQFRSHQWNAERSTSIGMIRSLRWIRLRKELTSKPNIKSSITHHAEGNSMASQLKR